MVHKHIARDFSQHEKSIYRPSDDYIKFEVFAYDPKSVKLYLLANYAEPFSKLTNVVKTAYQAWNCYKSKDKKSNMEFDFKYNAKEEGDYIIEIVYEQNQFIHNNKKFDTSKNLLGGLEIKKGSQTIYDKTLRYIGEDNCIKRIQQYQSFQKGVHQFHLYVPHNCYFYGVIIRRIEYYYGDNLDSAESNLQFTKATYTKSNQIKAAELSVEIGYDDDFENDLSPSGFYMDYMNECNLYVKDINGKTQRVFGGYISSILPDKDRTKLTITAADRLRDGNNKYILDEIKLIGGDKVESDYSLGMSKNFYRYGQVLKFLCNHYEVTLKSNVSKNYLVEGEKFRDGLTLKYGSQKNIKTIKATYGTTKPSKKFIMIRNNSLSTKEQSFLLYRAKDHAKAPPDISDYGYLHITYGLGNPKTEKKTKVTETVDVADTTAGSQKWGKCGQSYDGKYVMAIGQPSAGRTEGYSYNSLYKTIFENKCPHCGGKLVWDAGREGTGCVYCGGYSGSKRSWGDISETEITCESCCSDFCAVTGWEKDGGYSTRLTTYKKPVQSSREEQNKLFNGEMLAMAGEVSITADDIFKAVTKIAFNYDYRLGTTSSYEEMKAAGTGDCWAFSDLILTELKKYKVTCKIVEYGTAYAGNHRSVQYLDDNNNWQNFPYREQGWNTRYNNMLNDTDGVWHGTTIQEYRGNTIGNAKGTNSTTKQQTTEVTHTYGYDKDKPFQAYLEITYSTQQSFSAKKEKIFVDFTQVNSESNWTISGLKAYWINKAVRKSTLKVDICNFIRKTKYLPEDTHIYLQSLRFVTPKKEQKQGEDNDWYKYDKTTIDDSSCKMDLYQISFSNNAETEPSELNSCGKSVNAMMEEIIKDADYLVDMTYAKHRHQDVINFRVNNETKVKFVATEGDNNNILDWSNISYAPITTLFNQSIIVFKDHSGKYYYVNSRYAPSVLKYQSQVTLETVTDQIGQAEAYWRAINSDKYYQHETFSFTVVVPNYPHLRLGDMVQVISNARKLNTVKTVQSLKITYDIKDMPRIQTEIGLDELAPDMQLKQAMIKLRQNAKTERVYFSKSAIPVTDKDVYRWD